MVASKSFVMVALLLHISVRNASGGLGFFPRYSGFPRYNNPRPFGDRHPMRSRQYQQQQHQQQQHQQHQAAPEATVKDLDSHYEINVSPVNPQALEAFISRRGNLAIEHRYNRNLFSKEWELPRGVTGRDISYERKDNSFHVYINKPAYLQQESKERKEKEERRLQREKFYQEQYESQKKSNQKKEKLNSSKMSRDDMLAKNTDPDVQVREVSDYFTTLDEKHRDAATGYIDTRGVFQEY